MKYKVRFSEGNAQDWQEICEKAVEEGYTVNIAVPDVIILDTEEMTMTQDRNGSERPTVALDMIREELDMDEEPEAELIELVEVPEPKKERGTEELSGNTIITEGPFSMVTSSTEVVVGRNVGTLLISTK